MPLSCLNMGAQRPNNELSFGPHRSMTLDAKAPVSPVDPGIHVFRLALVDIFMNEATKFADN